jgi:hypothetical protein
MATYRKKFKKSKPIPLPKSNRTGEDIAMLRENNDQTNKANSSAYKDHIDAA